MYVRIPNAYFILGLDNNSLYDIYCKYYSISIIISHDFGLFFITMAKYCHTVIK